jgi:hypothetical protein
MNANNVSNDSKSVACPETTCSTRLARCLCSTAASARNWTTKARVTEGRGVYWGHHDILLGHRGETDATLALWLKRSVLHESQS